MHDTGLVQDYQLSVRVNILDPVFLEKFFEHLHNWEGCEDWEDKADKLEQIEASRQQSEKSILDQIAQAQQQWQEAMATLKDPTIPKTKQMKIDLADTCAGLEGKTAQLQQDLTALEDKEEEDDEVIQYQIYTLL